MMNLRHHRLQPDYSILIDSSRLTKLFSDVLKSLEQTRSIPLGHIYDSYYIKPTPTVVSSGWPHRTFRLRLRVIGIVVPRVQRVLSLLPFFLVLLEISSRLPNWVPVWIIVAEPYKLRPPGLLCTDTHPLFVRRAIVVSCSWACTNIK